MCLHLRVYDIKTMTDKESWLTKNHGSRSGFLKAQVYRLFYLSGVYNKYKTIDWANVSRLVFVCKGNICRSAYAEELARTLGIEAISFGLDTVDGAPANDRAVKTALSCGSDLQAHKTTCLQSVELKSGDLLVAMEPWQCKKLTEVYGGKYPCTLLGLWLRPVLPYIHDPYGMRPAYFKQCFVRIRRAVQFMAGKLQT